MEVEVRSFFYSSLSFSIILLYITVFSLFAFVITLFSLSHFVSLLFSFFVPLPPFLTLCRQWVRI